MNIQQWPVHQQRMYHKVKSSNDGRLAQFSDEQLEQFHNLGCGSAALQKCAELSGSGTDYPDELAEALTDQFVISMMENQQA